LQIARTRASVRCHFTAGAPSSSGSSSSARSITASDQPSSPIPSSHASISASSTVMRRTLAPDGLSLSPAVVQPADGTSDAVTGAAWLADPPAAAIT
jgi:hypothetical protein